MAVSLARPATAVAYGSTVLFEDLDARAPEPRLRCAEQTLLRVVSGTVGLSVEGTMQLLCAGAEAIVDAGARHTIESVDGPARILTGFRPVAGR
jgi:hypothetical protein